MNNNQETSQTSASHQFGASLVVNRQVIPLVKKHTTLGRQLRNDIVFHEEFISRYHAEITFEQGHYVLFDKNSTGGTYVNGRKIDHCVLNSGDLISLANIQIMFVHNTSSLFSRSLGTTHGLGESYYEQ